MKTQFFTPNYALLKSLAGLAFNILLTILVLATTFVVANEFQTVDFATYLNPVELLLKTWYLFLIAYVIKFLITYNAKRDIHINYWAGFGVEIILFIIAFVVFYLTGDASA